MGCICRQDTKRARRTYPPRYARLAKSLEFIENSYSKLLELLCALFGLVDNSLERLGMVDSEVGEDLAVDLDVLLVDEADELAVGYALHACGSVDTLNPQCTECTLLVTTITISVCKTFLPSILGYGPNILTRSIVTTCKL